MKRTRKPGISRRSTLALMGAGAVTFAMPWVARAQAKTIKVGMPTILSGRVAQLGTSSRNGVMLEVEKVNAAGGLAGRQIEMVIRDSKGQPQEAARVARELVNTDGCELLIDAEASSGAFAVHEVARDLGVFCIHTNSETSALTADPKQHIPNAFRTARQGVHDSIVGGSYAGPTAPVTQQLKGVHIYMGGIGLQQLFIFLFLALGVKFHREMFWLERVGSAKEGWKGLLFTLYGSLGFITVSFPPLHLHSYHKILIGCRSVSSSVSSSSPAATVR